MAGLLGHISREDRDDLERDSWDHNPSPFSHWLEDDWPVSEHSGCKMLEKENTKLRKENDQLKKRIKSLERKRIHAG
jgi:hypothetical protein